MAMLCVWRALHGKPCCGQLTLLAGWQAITSSWLCKSCAACPMHKPASRTSACFGTLATIPCLRGAPQICKIVLAALDFTLELRYMLHPLPVGLFLEILCCPP